jgi:phosphotriesterase-related protein
MKWEGTMDDRVKLTGNVITVLGLTPGEDLGFTLPHEHLLFDGSVYVVEPEQLSERALAHQLVSLENLSWIRYHYRDNFDVWRLSDVELAIRELTLFKLAGGRTVVECTPIDVGRDPMALARISRATGVNIIMGTGYYIAASHGQWVDGKTEGQIAERFVSEITLGVEGGVRSGVIGEIGCSWPLKDSERKVLRAAAYAQQQTGASIIIHPNRNETGPLEAIDVLSEAGARLNRVVISHMDRCGYLLETRLKILDAGCYLAYDAFGKEGYYPAKAALADEHLPDMPNDVGRIKEVKDLIGRGYLRQILVSQDICMKIDLTRWGGHGYAHILEHVIPLMKVYGLTEEQIVILTMENPKAMVSIQ